MPLTEDDLRRELAILLALEDVACPDWEQIAKLSLSLIERIGRNETRGCPDDVYHYIDDFDIRQRDQRYAEKQRAEVRNFLNQR